VLEEPRQVGLTGLREVVLVLGVEEEVLPALEEGLVDVHPAAVLPVHRLGHERGVAAVLARDLLHDVAVGDRLVGHLERFAVAKVNLVLAVRHFVVRGLDRDLHGLERLDRLGAELGPEIVGHLVEIARRIEEGAILHAPEIEVLELRPEIERVTVLVQLLQRALQHVARVAHVGGAVRVQDVADHPSGVLVVDLPG